MTGYKAGLKAPTSVKYSDGTSTGKTSMPSVKVGYAAGSKASNQTNRNGDPKSSHGK